MSADIQEMIEIVFGTTALIATAVTIAGRVAFIVLSYTERMFKK
jgi:hypothetical protein